tara:strand:- start:254 stop:1813 length:1560 start_codon:yes stop_codon:yes gene_type:complete
VVFLEIFFMIVVTVAIVFLLTMALYNIALVLTYRAKRGPDPEPTALFSDADLPRVTVQLPVYNEGTLAEQCLRLAAALDYPGDKLEIQYLDDSDDETTSEIGKATVEKLREEYPDITFQYLRRGNRHGFKAGALLYGTERATGEYMAIFDADFIIPPDFLRKTIHFFTDPGVGAVQARWDYVNEGKSLFTRLQANKLDAHQMFEQTARARSGRPVIFHGTAGVWRASALAEAGGWDCMSEVEDVEITVRATLAGWRVVYLDNFRLLSELPETINGFLRQQMRWRRGWSRVTAHYSGLILRGDIPWRNKLDLLLRIHLTWGPIGALIMILSVLPYFSIAAKYGLSLPATLLYTSGLVISLVTRHFEQKTLIEDPNARAPIALHPLLKFLPLNYLLFSMGTLWPLTQATFEGFWQKPVWEVTPKSGTTANSPGHHALIKSRRLPGYVIGTLALGALGAGLALYSAWSGFFLAGIFYVMLAIGCGYIGIMLLRFFGYYLGFPPASAPPPGPKDQPPLPGRTT